MAAYDFSAVNSIIQAQNANLNRQWEQYYQRKAEREAKKAERKGFVGTLVGAVAGAAITYFTGGAGAGLAAGLMSAGKGAAVGGALGGAVANKDTAGMVQGLAGAAQLGGEIQSAYSTADMMNKMDDGSMMRQLNAGQEFTPAQVYGMQQGGGMAFANAALSLVATANTAKIQGAALGAKTDLEALDRDTLTPEGIESLNNELMLNLASTDPSTPATSRGRRALAGRLESGVSSIDYRKALPLTSSLDIPTLQHGLRPSGLMEL